MFTNGFYTYLVSNQNKLSLKYMIIFKFENLKITNITLLLIYFSLLNALCQHGSKNLMLNTNNSM